MMRRNWIHPAALVVFVGALGAFAFQHDDRPTFEVASIKQVAWKGRGIAPVVEPGRLQMRQTTVGKCLLWAWDIQPYRVDAPEWVYLPRSGVFDIDAEAGSPAKESELRQMMQTLLADRFKLAVHWQKRTMPVYALSVRKSGAKLRRSEHTGKTIESNSAGTGSVLYGFTMAELSDALSESVVPPPLYGLTLPVVDRTGLSDRYDIALQMRFREDEMSRWTGLLNDLHDAGLELEKTTAGIDVLVVDRIEKLPTGN